MKDYFLVKKRNMTVPVRFSDICYFENSLRLILLHTVTNQFRFYGVFRHMENDLDQRFYRCHYSFIINMDYVLYLEGHRFIMVGGDSVPISQRRYAIAKATYLAYLQG